MSRNKYYSKQYNSMAHSMYNILRKEGAVLGKGSINKIQESLQKSDRRLSEKNYRLVELGEDVYDMTALDLYESYKGGFIDKNFYLDSLKELLVEAEEYKMDEVLEMRLNGFMEKYGELEFEFNGKKQTLKEWEEDLDTGAISNNQFNDMMEQFKHSDLYEKTEYERNKS